MDCCERDRSDLAYTFLNAYLDTSGDYRGAELLAYFAAYRSMVRAKVAALRWEQEAGAASEARFRKHVEWARDVLDRPTGTLILMCGLSGSGKSYIAERLAPRLPAIHLRSDVARKTLAGLDTLAQTNSPVGGGLYAPGRSDEVFAYLADVAGALLSCGEHVIVDATFIEKARRQQFFKIAESLHADAKILLCEAPLEVLQDRIRQRSADNNDASEATLEVLESQLTKFVPPGDDEPVVRHAADQRLDGGSLAALVAAVLPRG
jgi:predicted kinase